VASQLNRASEVIVLPLRDILATSDPQCVGLHHICGRLDPLNSRTAAAVAATSDFCSCKSGLVNCLLDCSFPVIPKMCTLLGQAKLFV